jgi:hypothetical protein
VSHSASRITGYNSEQPFRAAEHLAPRSVRQARTLGTVDDPGWLKSRFARCSAARLARSLTPEAWTPDYHLV